MEGEIFLITTHSNSFQIEQFLLSVELKHEICQLGHIVT
jgi:hypothetical protein